MIPTMIVFILIILPDYKAKFDIGGILNILIGRILNTMFIVGMLLWVII